MSQYEITKHTQKLPHKQSFEVMLSCRISDEKLEELTREISREYRIADEKMFFHWWNPSQNRAKEVCWANSSWDGTYEFGTNLMTQEEFAASVGVTQSYLSLIEKGHKTPSLEVLQQIWEIKSLRILRR